jgi:hypothetical protein
MRFGPAIAFVAAALGCRKAPPAASEQDTRPPPAAAADASTVAVTAPADAASVDCAEYLGPIRVAVSSAYSAKESTGPYKKAVELWPGVPDACRNGEWYIFAAKLLAWVGVPKQLEATGVVLESRDQALAQAVTHSLDANALEYVALVAAAGGATKLPANACAIAEPEDNDDARYVCGHAALAAGDAAGAKARFEAIEVPGLYPDLDLRRAEAELALGNKAAARKLAKRAAALDSREARWRFASTADWEAIVAAAKAIAK